MSVYVCVREGDFLCGIMWDDRSASINDKRFMAIYYGYKTVAQLLEKTKSLICFAFLEEQLVA